MRTSSPAFSNRPSSIPTSTGKSKTGLFGAILTVGLTDCGDCGCDGMFFPQHTHYISGGLAKCARTASASRWSIAPDAATKRPLLQFNGPTLESPPPESVPQGKDLSTRSDPTYCRAIN